MFEGSFVRPYLVMLEIVEKVLGDMKFPISRMNITIMSYFWKDAHPSVYRKDLRKEERKRLNKNDGSAYGARI